MALLIGDILAVAANQRPAAIGATLGARARTFAQLDEAANPSAQALAGLGVGAGDIVAFWAGPTLRALELMAGVARLGGVFSPLSPLLGPGEAEQVLDYLQPRLVVAAGGPLEMASRLGLDARLAAVDASGPGVDLDGLTQQSSPSAISPP